MYTIQKLFLKIRRIKLLYSGSYHVTSGIAESIKDAVSLKHREAEAETEAERWL